MQYSTHGILDTICQQLLKIPDGFLVFDQSLNVLSVSHVWSPNTKYTLVMTIYTVSFSDTDAAATWLQLYMHGYHSNESAF